jgi:prepilin peptidase CpaA
MDVAGCIQGAALGVALTGAYTDARTGHIPNPLTLGSLAIAPLLWFGAVAATEHSLFAGLHAAGLSAVGGLVCALGPAFFFWRGGMGGGDVKLLAALGALLGPTLGLNAEMLAFGVALLWVPGRLAWEGELFSSVAGALRVAFVNPFLPRARRHATPASLVAHVRLGPAIFVGTLVAFVHRSLA